RDTPADRKSMPHVMTGAIWTRFRTGSAMRMLASPGAIGDRKLKRGLEWTECRPELVSNPVRLDARGFAPFYSRHGARARAHREGCHSCLRDIRIDSHHRSDGHPEQVVRAVARGQYRRDHATEIRNRSRGAHEGALAFRRCRDSSSEC